MRTFKPRAWIIQESFDDSKKDRTGRPKRTRGRKVGYGTKGIKPGDRFVVQWKDPTAATSAGKRVQYQEKIEGTGKPAKKLADDRCQQINAQMTLGTYERKETKTWAKFRELYEDRVLGPLRAPRSEGGKGKRQSAEVAETVLKHFERICHPALMASVDTEMIDAFVAKRRTERGRKPGSTVSMATVNKDLRHLKAVLRKAERWGYLRACPQFEMQPEDDKIVRYVTEEHWAAIYEACDKATCHSADWWRACCTAATTGWRINELMTMLWEDLDLETGRVLLRAGNTKGGRFDELRLNGVVVDHLRKLPHDKAEVFGWHDKQANGERKTHRNRSLWDEFHDIQKAAGIHLKCYGEHEHTDACHFYGFHDLRRAAGTYNATRMTAVALQKMMRHKSFTTTQRYINSAPQLDEAADKVWVPKIPVLNAVTVLAQAN